MTADSNPAFERPPDPVSDHPTNRTGRRIDHVTVENADAPDACTLYPTDASTADLRSTWITAREGAFRDRETIR